jgi:hypothetical protein
MPEPKSVAYDDAVHLSMAISRGVLWYSDDIWEAKVLLMAVEMTRRRWDLMVKEVIISL